MHRIDQQLGLLSIRPSIWRLVAPFLAVNCRHSPFWRRRSIEAPQARPQARNGEGRASAPGHPSVPTVRVACALPAPHLPRSLGDLGPGWTNDIIHPLSTLCVLLHSPYNTAPQQRPVTLRTTSNPPASPNLRPPPPGRQRSCLRCQQMRRGT